MRESANSRAEARVFRVWRLLSKTDRRKILIIAVIQIFLGFLDLLGVIFIGIIGVLAVNGFGTQQPNNGVDRFLNFLNLTELSLQSQVGVLALLATLVFILKTGFSAYFTRRILNYLSYKGAELSVKSVQYTFRMSILQINSRPQQELLFTITSGPSTLMVNVLGTAITLVTDASLMVVLGIALLIVDPLVATFSIIVFSGLGFLMYKLLQKRATYLGMKSTELSVKSGSQLIEVLHSYRFLTVRDRKDYFAQQIKQMRMEFGAVSGENSFMPYISKYVFETAVVLGTLLIAASQFLTQDAAQAVATLSIFMAAGSRIAPAALRIQQSGLTIKNNLGVCEPVLKFLEDVPWERVKELDIQDPYPKFDHVYFHPSIAVRKVSFRYPGSSEDALENISFDVHEGSVTSIVGPSGSGKSTLADLLLGILLPDSGSILLSHHPIDQSVRDWPGAMSYVPQEVALMSGTIRENVAMGFATEFVPEAKILEALEMAQLKDFALSLPEGIDTLIGERGTRLSGGQKQRLGIARALFTKPKLIVLDEATSSLDGSIEADISSAIHNLRGSVTVVMIAHRLSTVKSSDQLIYLSNGKLVSQGSFDQVRSEVPDFDKQAQLMGL
jgi:ABC-type multidrug transport system fused ATPase/permease subunit